MVLLFVFFILLSNSPYAYFAEANTDLNLWLFLPNMQTLFLLHFGIWLRTCVKHLLLLSKPECRNPSTFFCLVCKETVTLTVLISFNCFGKSVYVWMKMLCQVICGCITKVILDIVFSALLHYLSPTFPFAQKWGHDHVVPVLWSFHIIACKTNHLTKHLSSFKIL